MKKGAISLSEWCQREQKPQLLALYDRERNPLPPSEIPHSSAKENYQFRCPVCGISWEQTTNKFVCLEAGNYNYIKKRKEITFCPYFRGERISSQYNMATEFPDVLEWWDYKRNPCRPEECSPSTHLKYYLECPDCHYALPQPACIKDRGGIFRCPRCGDGKQQEVTSFNCLEACYPEIAKELDDGRNGGITGKNILPSYNKKLWFVCSNGHHYKARLSNRTYLGRGCPKCNRQFKTSFVEQAICFYLRKCEADLQNGQADPHTGREIDIFLPSCKTALEFNSLYCHTTLPNGQRIKADLEKVYQLAQYYRVYVLLEEGAVLPVQNHPLIHTISVPVFSFSQEKCRKYDDIIYNLMQLLFPTRDSYPNINIMRDHLLILQQYINTTIKGSFEECYPLLAADWHPVKNGALTPSMFRPNVTYKFNWICRRCKKTYRMSMANRLKVNPDTCPFCCHKSRYASPLLCETYPFLKAFWNASLNPTPFSDVSVASEAYGIFELVDGRLVPVKICNLSSWLSSHSSYQVEEYLERQLEKANKLLLSSIEG